MRFKLVEDYKDAYLDRTNKHISRVVKYGNKIGKDYSEHDRDKLTTLFDGYSLMTKKDKFGGSDIKDNMSGVTAEEEKKIDNVTLIHVTTNTHHPEY